MRKVLCGIGLAWIIAAVAGTALAQDKPAAAPQAGDDIVAEWNAVKMPQFDRSRQNDTAYVAAYEARGKQAMDQRGQLALKLWEINPDHPQAMKLMATRWRNLSGQGQADQVTAEIDAAIAKFPARKADLRFTQTQLAMMNWDSPADQVLASAEAFVKEFPGDPRAGDLLAMAAGRFEDQPDQAMALYRRIVTDFPEARSAAQARGKIRQMEGVGKPFELAFTDAITGKPVSMADLRGKVVVVDFWATWCGPCVAEMPHMKEIYAKYRDKGVEFIGISLDQPEAQGGLEKLKAFVAENQLPWPQYYQGAGWESEFSKSWGINAIPALFVIDQHGKLYSTNARGQVEQFIEKLLTNPEKVGG